MATSTQTDIQSAPVHSSADSVSNDSRNGKTDAVVATESVDDNASPTTKSGSTWRRMASFFWDSIDGDPQYRAYVRRLDLIFL